LCSRRARNLLFFLGNDDRTFINAAFIRAGKQVSAERVVEINTAKTARWREIVSEEMPLFEGVEDFIKKMEKDFALGIVSMARREEIEYVLEKTNLRSCFLSIVSADDVSNCKPDPECYLKGFNLIDAARTARGGNPIVHGDCLVIEDSPPAFGRAKAPG
jgi:beta-phosphoglucomutase-like phosphatase (HAD superfamily)